MIVEGLLEAIHLLALKEHEDGIVSFIVSIDVLEAGGVFK